MLIIAISGCSGSGKTSLVRALVQMLPESSPLFSDTYSSAYCPTTIDFPLYRHLGLSDAEMCQKWFDEGFPEDGYASYPRLVQDIQALKNGESVLMPIRAWEGAEHEIHPNKYLFLEDAWAHRAEMRDLVDYFVHINIPLDIAVARFVQRQVRQNDDIGSLVERYLTLGFKNSRAVGESRKHHHLTLDGMKDVHTLANEVIKWLKTSEQGASTQPSVA